MKHHIIYRISHILCIVLCLSACNEETCIDMTSQELSPLQFYTSSANTRTSLFDDGTTVVWSEKDELAVYDYETSKHRFVSEHIDGASALFEGKITKQKENFLALYPYELGAEKLSENQEVFTYQLGFYSSKTNAQNLVNRCKEKNISAQIQQVTRPSGNVYFAVIVKSTDSEIGTIIKNSGFECYPIFE